MAKQTGVFQIQGSLDNLCFYKTAHGYMVRKKGGVSREKLKHDPAFARVRENNADFARTGKAVKLFREAFAPLLQRAGDKGATRRLMGLMYEVMATDEVNPRGQRKVASGQLQLLEGFEFNEKRALTGVLGAPFTTSIDSERRVMTLDVPEFSPSKLVSAPEAATHFWVTAGVGVVDFDNNIYDAAIVWSDYAALDRKKPLAMELVAKIKAGTPGRLIILVGIEFGQLRNGEKILLSNSENALSVVTVSQDE